MTEVLIYGITLIEAEAYSIPISTCTSLTALPTFDDFFSLLYLVIRVCISTPSLLCNLLRLFDDTLKSLLLRADSLSHALIVLLYLSL